MTASDPSLLLELGPSFVPFMAALLSLWDRAGVPLAFLIGLSLTHDEPTQWLMLCLCCVAGLIGDLACVALGRMIATSSTPKTRLTRSRSGLTHLVMEYARFVEPSPRLWTLASRLFPLMNQWVMVALGVTRRPWCELILLCALGNASLFGVSFALWRLGELSLSPQHQPWLPLLGLALAFTSLKLAQRATRLTPPHVESSP